MIYHDIEHFAEFEWFDVAEQQGTIIWLLVPEDRINFAMSASRNRMCSEYIIRLSILKKHVYPFNSCC
jgi:hypothetical protein